MLSYRKENVRAMFYDRELDFLCSTLQKCRVAVSVISPDESIGDVIDSTLRDVLNNPFDPSQSVHQYVGVLEANTLHKITDEFKLCYIYLLLPSGVGECKMLFIGPFLSERISSGELFELGERMGISPKSQRYLEEYYASIPVISEGDLLFVLINTFCEYLWGSEDFAVVDANKQHGLPESPIHGNTHGDNFNDILVNMKAMEKRYEFENEMMQAVTLGQIHKEALFTADFSEKFFEKRLPDHIRNLKNYAIIMNTLLRKAAERGGVHPIYIDRVSSEFAAKIEQISSFYDNSSLMKEMFRTYCRLVRKHSMQKYSPVVQKTILAIDTDLSADLSLYVLAKHQSISRGYLSAVFKKETGKTVSEYIREKRMKHAMHLLGTTHLQVQTVALHCGIMDVQYFSKLFKAHTGKTPKEYRESLKKA